MAIYLHYLLRFLWFSIVKNLTIKNFIYYIFRSIYEIIIITVINILNKLLCYIFVILSMIYLFYQRFIYSINDLFILSTIYLFYQWFIYLFYQRFIYFINDLFILSTIYLFYQQFIYSIVALFIILSTIYNSIDYL